MDAFSKYIKIERTIEGPMRIECAFLIAAVVRSLNELFPYAGDLMEIGVLSGRSAIPGACFLQEREVFYAIDPFETFDDNPVLRFGGIGSQEVFLNNWQNIFGHSDNLKLFTMDSKSFFEANMKNDLELNRPFKYVSIDGDHSFEGTMIDLEYAVHLINDYGVIAIDDVYNIEWPTVSQALNHFLSCNSQIVPFCSGWGRLFLCREEILAKIQEKTRMHMNHYRNKMGPYFSILRSFGYYGNQIDIYSNRWGSASKVDLRQNAYMVGAAFQLIEDRLPISERVMTVIRKILRNN